jgi:molecular chaperone HscB
LTPSLPDTSTHYTLFQSTLPKGPPPAGPFAIPLPTLRKEFLQLQSQHHPDKAPSGTPLHQQTLALSALINTAYRTLSDPLLRAQYLLQLRYGVDVASEDNMAHPADQATLLEVMEAQERIEEAAEQAEIEALKRENDARTEEAVAKLGDAFENDDREEAVTECVRLRYWRNLSEGLADWEKGKEVRLVH